MILNTRLKRLILVFIVVGFVILYKILSGNNTFSPKQLNIPTVSTYKVTRQNIPLTFEYPARVSGIKEVEVRAQISGILLETNYTEGALVQQGDILFTIDPKPFIATYKTAEAELSAAKSVLTQSEKTFSRTKTLYKKNVVSSSAQDVALSNYEQAKSGVKQAQEKLTTARINLDYTKVKAPISGMSSDAIYSEGNLIDNGSLLTKIVQTESMYINFSYPEGEYNHIKELIQGKRVVIPADKLLRAKIKLENGTILAEEGIVDFTDSKLDPNTASVMARIVIKNSNDHLISNQYVRVQIKGIDYKEAITIPDKAIIYTPNGTSVYLVNKDSKLEIRPVTLGMLTNNGMLVTKGLEAGDQLITDGMIQLKPGQEVKIKDTSDPIK